MRLLLLCLLLQFSIMAQTTNTAFEPLRSEPPLRVGVIGLVHTHVHWILGREDQGDIEIVGIVEPNRELAAQYSLQHGYSMDIVYNTIEEMVAAQQPHAVTAFNTIYDHLSVVEYCAPRGIHVMVEDEATIIITYPTTQVVIQASWNWSHNRKEMEVYGTHGYIFCKNGTDMIVMKEEVKGPQPHLAEPLPPGLHDPFAYLSQVIQYGYTVNPWDVSALTNNLRVMQILEAAKVSAQTGNTVRWAEFFGS